MKILFATHNLNKVNEAKAIISDSDIEIVSLFDLKDTDEVIENGSTFSENAHLKANYYHIKYHMPVFSDDSGLAVHALDGNPGINSARYASDHCSYLENNLLLLKNLENEKNREAYFITVICYIDSKNTPWYFEGRLYGEIAHQIRGENGFGYDPLFYLPDHKKTLAELPSQIKNSLSHRYRALSRLKDHLMKEGILWNKP